MIASQFTCNISFSVDFQAIIDLLKILNLNILPSLGLACRVKNYDYVDALVGVTLVPIFFVAFLVSLFGLEVAFHEYKKNKSEAILRQDKRYAIPDDLANVFSFNGLRILRRAFSYFDKDRSGTANVSQFPLFQGLSELSFSDYLYTIHRAQLENRRAEVSDFINAAEAKANARRGEYKIFTLLLFSFIILIRISRTIFEYFQCTTFEEAEPPVTYLVRDFSLNCASSRYKSYLAYAVAMLFIYPLG